VTGSRLLDHPHIEGGAVRDQAAILVEDGPITLCCVEPDPDGMAVVDASAAGRDRVQVGFHLSFSSYLNGDVRRFRTLGARRRYGRCCLLVEGVSRLTLPYYRATPTKLPPKRRDVALGKRNDGEHHIFTQERQAGTANQTAGKQRRGKGTSNT